MVRHDGFQIQLRANFVARSIFRYFPPLIDSNFAGAVDELRIGVMFGPAMMIHSSASEIVLSN